MGLLLLSRAAVAHEPSAARVIALEVVDAPWPEGEGAIFAELRANGYAVEQRALLVRLASELDPALERIALDADAVAALAVSREGPKGVVRVRTKRFGLRRLEVELSGGSLSRSRLALAVVDSVRVVDIPKSLASAPRPVASPARALAFSIGAGLATAGSGAPWPWASGSGRWLLLPPLGVEITVGLSPWASPAKTVAGKVELRAEQAMAYLAFEPFAGRRLSFALGLGGGVCVVHGRPSPGAGFAGLDGQARVASLGVRARGSLRSGNALISVNFEPGVLVPAVRLQETNSTLLALGRPWLVSTLSVGWLL